ncbi:MAG: type III CRISPR-associated protein [Bacteroidetes bacterium 4484_249]|nr:MAG: type III CRISPR-associated protein [Bacteroidetes bacterium 4484_249]
MNLNEINNTAFEGYVWLSDKDKPRMLKGETFNFSKYEDGNNPFIIEALLFDKATDVSYTVRHTGKYIIGKFNLNDYTDENFVGVEYLSHRLKDVNKVNFKQLWLPEEDENCEGMPVMKMKALIFTGFDCKTEK